MMWLELGAGLVLLLAGGEALVRGSVALATRLGVSQLVIGLTLVGFGTSMPELVASLQAALAGSPGVAVGNVVGSNIANILLIMGVAAVILPVTVGARAFRRDGAVLVAASLVLTAVVLSGELGRIQGLVLLGLLVAYTAWCFLAERAQPAEGAVTLPGMGPLASLALTAAGIAGVVGGADLLVGASIELARGVGVSEAVIGLTLVAVGTSLPELVTGVMAALRGHSDVAFGNVVGSNIFNILGIAGVTAVVVPLEVPAEIAGFDIWAMLAAALLLVWFSITGWRISRREGWVFLGLYGGYLTAQMV